MKYLKYLAKRIRATLIEMYFKALEIFGSIMFLLMFGFTMFVILGGIYVFKVKINVDPTRHNDLTDIKYTAVVNDESNENRSIKVTEYVTYDLHSGFNNPPYTEVVRKLPRKYKNGLKIAYEIESVSKILDNGQEILCDFSKHDVSYENDEAVYTCYYTPNAEASYKENHLEFYSYYKKNYVKFYKGKPRLVMYIPPTTDGKVTFKIEYKINQAKFKYADCSEIELNIYSGKEIKKLNSFEAQILIPNNIMPSQYDAVAFGSKISNIPFIESSVKNPGYNTFAIILDRHDLQFNYYNEYLTFDIVSYGNNKHIFTKYVDYNRYEEKNHYDKAAKKNYYYSNLKGIIDNCKLGVLLSMIILSIIININAIRKYKALKKKANIPKSEYNNTYYREIPSNIDPLFASELVFMYDTLNDDKEKYEEYAALLLSLARKKYITLTKKNIDKAWNKKNTLITINENIAHTNHEEFNTAEALYLDFVQEHMNGKSISLYRLNKKIKEDPEGTHTFKGIMEAKPTLKLGINKGYYQDNDYDKYNRIIRKQAKKSIKWSFVILIFTNAISYLTPLKFCFGAYIVLSFSLFIKHLYLISKSNSLTLFTQKGVNEQAKWRGLYNYLKSNSLLHEKNIIEVALWEKYLVYATAFGISNNVIKAIKLNTPRIDTDSSYILYEGCFINNCNFHAIARSLYTSIHYPPLFILLRTQVKDE